MTTLSHLLAKIILIGLLSLSFKSVFATSPQTMTHIKSDTSSYLKIEGNIVVETKEVKGTFLLEVVYFDSVVQTLTVKNNLPVKLTLKKDAAYTLRISKKGYISRSISLNTSLSGNSNDLTSLSFYFETDFIKVADAMRMDSEALEMPIAIITYHEKAANFVHNKDYSIFVRQRLYAGTNDTPLLSVRN